jgi:uncharacterized protein (DUF58 family)
MASAGKRHLVEGERAGMRYALGVPRQAPIGVAGTTLAARAGSSLEFKDHRDYQPGDDVRHLDWGAYARSDQLVVKLFREEVTPHLDLVLDASRSMDLEDTRKGEAALALTGFLVAAAGNAGYSHSAWRLAAECRPVGNGTKGPSLWEELSFDHVGPPGALTPQWRPRGLRVLVSDLLWLGEPLSVLRPLADRAATTVVIQVLARADVEVPVGQSFRLVDSETDEVREIHIDAGTARRYREALARHQENWQRACRQVGGVFTSVVAEELLREWRLNDLVAADVLRVR